VRTRDGFELIMRPIRVVTDDFKIGGPRWEDAAVNRLFSIADDF
jgi:hypothetical protein